MLQSVRAGSLSLPPQACFLDTINNQLYFLGEGKLRSYNTATQEQTTITVNAHTANPNHYSPPSLLIISGEALINVDKNLVSALSDEVVLRASVEIVDGSQWQWHAPISLQKVKLGLCKVEDNEEIKYQFFDFNSSTPRNVTFAIQGDQLLVWVNGHPLTKGSSKTISYDSGKNKWYPCVKLQEKANTIYFSPFTSYRPNAASPLNPFAKIDLSEPVEQPALNSPLDTLKITKIVQLSKDRLMVVWDNNSLRIFQRSSKTGKFDFSALTVHDNGTVSNVFNEQQYKMLRQWRGEDSFFSYQHIFTLQNLHSCIRYLISSLDNTQSTRSDIYALLLTKLAVIRPYLPPNIRVPNPIRGLQSDLQPYEVISHYFTNPTSSSPTLISGHSIRSALQYRIQGSILEISQNYLVTRSQNTIIVYCTREGVNQVFRQVIDKKLQFSKRSAAQAYQEQDIRNLKSEGSFLYKILSTCLQKEKRNEEAHTVNENDVKELVRDYGIDQAAAREALQETGHVEQALVWIFTDRKDAKGKRAESLKQIQSGASESVHLVEVNHIFARALLQVGNRLFLLGVLPQQIRRYFQSGEMQFADLLTLKHQDQITEFNWQAWYRGKRHPRLHILEQIQITSPPELLFREGDNYYYLLREEQVYYKKAIKINTELLYEPNESLSLTPPEPLQFFPKQTPEKTINGQLISQELIETRSYQEGTFWSNGKEIFSNIVPSAQAYLLRVQLQAPLLPELPSDVSSTIPLLVESGPPGCSSNYSITSILHPKSTFLANYPQEVILKNLHGKLIKPSSLTLHRSSHRKNINYITEGEIYLIDQWGTHSAREKFSFSEGETEKIVNVNQAGFWKYVVVSPKFTSTKKLPFEYGFISIAGWEVSTELYQHHLLSSLSSFLSSALKHPLTAIEAQRVPGGRVSALLKVQDSHSSLTQIIQKGSQLNIRVKQYQIVPSQQLAVREEISYLPPAEIIKLLCPPGCKIEGVLRRISHSPIFTFSNFSKTQVLKFADLSLYYTGSLLPFQNHFASIFHKLWQNQHGREYLLQLSQSLHCAPTLPFPYLTLLGKQLESAQHVAIIKSLLNTLPRVRSARYEQLDRKHSHLLFQSQFYSDYYFNLVQGSSISRETVYGEAAIEAEVISVKEQHCRRIIIRLPGTHYINNFTLRIQRSEQPSKANYSIYVLGEEEKRRIGSGRIHEHQWLQVSKEIYKQEQTSKDLNIYGLDVTPVLAQYLEIELAFTETGLACHKSETQKIAQVDIIPELYGYPTDLESRITHLQNIFTFNPEEMFFLSVSALGSHPLQKYSVSRGKQTECIYFKPQREDEAAIKARIEEKIEKNDLDTIPNLQRKLLRNSRKFSSKLCLDYLYTALVLSLSELQARGVTLQESVCSELFELIVRSSQGPVKTHAFRALSKSIPLLVKSLQYVQDQLPSLGKLSFSYEELLSRVDLSNLDLCNSLTRLILRVVDFEPRWAELLIKMAPKTQCHQEIIKYFLSSESWLQNTAILEYVADFADSFFQSTFLPLLSYKQLCRLVTKASSKPRLQLLLQVIVEQASTDNQVDLDVVSLIFQQEEVRWQQLEKVVTCCPQAVDTVVHQFLQAQNAESLALQHFILLNTAATPKYSEEFALFLTQVYGKNRTAFREVMISIIGKCQLLHYDSLETIGNFIFSSCNFGGIEGVRLLTENDLSSLTVAVEALKIMDKLPQGAEVPSEDVFIEWYLSNNDYEEGNRNPANKAAGYHLIRQLGEFVRGLLKASTSSRVLAKYAEMVQKLRGSRRISLPQRHLKFSQLHHGATLLLSHSLAPGALAQVLVGQPSPALPTVLNELKASMLRDGKRAKWIAKEVDISEKFELKNAEAKDLQNGKNGSKASIARIPISQRTLRLQSTQAQWPSKFLIGFALNDHVDSKTALLPARAELYAGSGQALFKVGQLRVIEDQHFLSFGVRVFGINLSAITGLPSHTIRTLEVRLGEAALASASEVLESSQRSKKGATFSLSFVTVSGFDSLPNDHPDYSQLYLTLLGFLGQPKYLPDLKRVVASDLFDQKLELIIQVLNDLLPNQLIQNLLLSLNREGENILEHVLRSNSANPRLVSKLLLGKLTKDNIGKLLAYTLDHLSREYVDIVTMSVRLASYGLAQKSTGRLPLDFGNIEHLLQKYGQTEGESKQLYFQLLTTLLTVPHLYHYEISRLVQVIWNNSKRSEFYAILAAVLPYYPQESEIFATNNYTNIVFDELVKVMEENRKEEAVLRNPNSHIMLLNTLNTSPASRTILLTARAPIKLVQLLKSEKSLLLKYSSEAMKQLIAFFQGTCIATECQDEFSEILIALMTSLNNFDASHHQFFIQNFFFPLINAFSGVPLFFVWRHGQQHLWQPTEVLKRTPIRSSSSVITYKEKYYAPVELITEASPKGDLLVTLKENGHTLFRVAEGEATDLQTGKTVGWTYADGKLTIQVKADSHLVLPNEKYRLYEESEWEQQLLTNSTLINLNNPWILEEKYRTVLPIRDSTTERTYFLPQEITLGEVLKHINISGFRVHPTDLPTLRITNLINGAEVPHEATLRDVLSGQHLPFLRLQIEASQLFKSTTIETLVEQAPLPTGFVAQETIFKAFQEKKGLQKLIGVLTGCVKNWVNTEQSKIWQQYLKELESYSCFPVFSSLYMTRQANVALLFDLLFGLPDKQDSKKWVQREKQSVRELYGIIKDVFAVQGQQAQQVRQYALTSGFYATMLNRLHLITKEPRREKVEEEPAQEEVIAPSSLPKKVSEDEFKNKLTKRKGVGYGTDSSTNQKWDVSGQEEARKEQSEQILGLLRILEKFLDYKDFELPDDILTQTYESALLPIIQNSLRGGSLLQISKYAELIQGELSFIQVLARSKKLVPTLMAIPKCYEPRQPQSLHSLLKTLANTAKIFLSCLTGSASQKVSEQIAKKIAATFQIVDGAVSEYQTAHNDEEEDRKVLQLPLAKKYPILLKDLRFDYIDMKDNNGKISKHHYASYYQPAHKSPVDKTVRLAQELADVSHALPIDHTNAIFVRCDKERVDYMQALIMGSNGTPYGHGAYLFDIYFEDNYPSGPPKVNLTTTGNGQIRFNPNLYSCGKVCLSLLGTWRGSAMENWDPKVSTLLQVLVSIQSIIMSQDIYFNEPGFEHQQGTLEGQKKNEAYANIVRYGNVKFAMIDNIKNPPKGFETVIRRHFFLKRQEILEECQKWLKLAEKREASYNGLVSDHNYNWCNTFKKSKNEYKTMLQKAVKELEMELNKLPPPTHEDLKKEQSPTKPKRKTNIVPQTEKQEVILEEIDVSYGEQRENVELDINNEKVKDRWSRYIGAMGVEAVSKQSKADILLLGLGGLGVQIAKNIVLSGCRELALWDNTETSWSDLSGQFFLGQNDIGKSRLEGTIYKLRELNHYVKVQKYDYDPSNLSSMGKYQVVIATGISHEEQLKINQFCRSSKIHFLSADCYGPYGQVFNDFGESFQILDKNGEETVQVILEDISCAEKGLVRVSKGLRHPFEDGQTVRIAGVKGMRHKQKQGESINGTLHKVQVIDQFSFYIGNTEGYEPYEGDGTARNIKTPLTLTFKPLAQSASEQNIDANLEYYDFTKGGNLRVLHRVFIALSQFRTKHNRLPSTWSKEDAQLFVEEVKTLKADLSGDEENYVRLFSYTCSGNFGPICAFYGGIVSQEVFKAITGKYTPIHQYFLADFSEVLPEPPQNEEEWPAFLETVKLTGDRREGILKVVGKELLTKLENSKIFMVGSGAIGCQLLKNFAMLEVGAGESGSIVVTDPDHIETSNLNRQFLFREKHLRKPKSATASAAVSQMNPRLKGHIKARLDKVCESTKDIFSNSFFEGLSIVANALDNVEARRYVDSRCVQNKVALLESGTLSSKGHVQVIIPYQTETYGSKQDPNDANGEVPHCTLKMFPEQTLHCVEWARDLFGKDFTLAPKALSKLLQAEQTFTPTPSDIQMLKDCIKMLSDRPANFEEAAGTAARVFYQLFRNDILQLLYTYPLDAKTKDGKPFWRLPKRPPTPIEQILPEDPLHATFIASYAVLISKVHKLPYPKDFRDPLKRREIAEMACAFKVEPFVPSDKVAKEMAQEVNNDGKQSEAPKQEVAQEGEAELFQKFKQALRQIKQGGDTPESRPEEFEKDEDQNGHIDVIYSMANLRARNYKLQEMQWISVKLKAGRIMPALSTTTSCIAALQTIELIKYIKGCKAPAMRNAFVNLAVPLVQLGQPGEVEKIKVHQQLTTNVWERWTVSLPRTATLRQLIQQVQKSYGVVVKGLDLVEGGQVYSDIVLGLESKKEERERVLSKALSELLEDDAENAKFTDFTLVMAVKEELIKHAPTLRVTFT